MVLESTIICVDNSEYSRNGDFPPSRFAAQIDSINMLCSAKVNANPESTVGLLTLAGRSTTMLVTSTRDLGRVFTSLHAVNFDGSADVMSGIQKAQLALKHRQNTHQRQRIVVFLSSPLNVPVESLVRLGKLLKKNNVAVDVIDIGTEGENIAKVDTFIEAVNSGDNSHALHVEAGSQNLVEALMQSEIYMDRDGAPGVGTEPVAGSGGGGGDASEYPYGVDPSVDPELAMVLRISMEEERARQAAAREAEEKAQREQGEKQETDTGAAASASASGVASGGFDDNDDDLYGTEGMEVDAEGAEEEMLRAAIELSKKEAEELEKNDKGEDK
eukprot:GFKZ01003828.1.p1 GENE.GFKZ01003828.1~~GFKZ01003828.1.p1  ORF type:complete len:330 (+),score=74.47 GFKZ01003828.1:177-1166(+)